MVRLNIDLPESFFLEEERDGYLVSAKMKELWAVQLDLLNELDRVCKKYNLKYILDFGTLLGAIRHKGFIPWDDDVDVSMLREDYDKLMEVASDEFKEPYFLQTQYTDKNYDDCVTKLRRSDTCCLPLSDMSREPKYNRGIFIDIFVFDHMPATDKATIKTLAKESQDTYYRITMLTHFPNFAEGFKLPGKLVRYYFYRMKYGSAQKEFRRLEQRVKSYRQTGDVGLLTYVYPRWRPLSIYNDIIEVPFENMILPAPADYDTVLQISYGDYMVPVQGASAHSVISFDANRSYKDVLGYK